MSSIWIILVSLAAFAVAYRLYGAFLAAKVAVLDDRRITPAHRLRDGVDFHPTNRWVLFGHHFAAIAGPGPLIGPVLAAQWGYLPGLSWIVIGACLAGGAHDFVILLASVRQGGLSLPRIARDNIGRVAGVTTSVATMFIIVCTMASVAIVVVNALAESSWGMFTILLTIPAALLTGLWMYKIRPGKVAEASAIGVGIVLLGVILGRPFAESSAGASLLFSKQTLSIALPIYACIASILPVWALMCPRDYLSSYMKIGVMVVLGAGLIIANPTLKMPATTMFTGGGGPVISGAVWPYVCITIMCGAISGFHALIASGTTPKMLDRERDIRPIGYGAMVVEGFVAVTALVAACALEPGDYFAINVAQDTAVQQAQYAKVVAGAADAGWAITPRELPALEQGVGETLTGRTGGAVTLAVGMAKVFSSLPGMGALMSYWYHFVIMFEALFILTLLETGTRVARFVFQEAISGGLGGTKAQRHGGKAVGVGASEGGGGDARALGPMPCMGCGYDLSGCVGSAAACPACGRLMKDATPRKARPNWALNIGLSILCCGMWGYLLYSGDLNNLWSMLGIANQLLASIALAVGTTYLLNHAPKRIYALCTGIPFVFVLATTLLAGSGRIGEWMERLGPLRASGRGQDVFMTQLLITLACVMLGLTVVIATAACAKWWSILRSPAAARAAPV